MAFEVLFNFTGNVERLLQDLETAKRVAADSAERSIQNIRRIDKAHQSAVAEYHKRLDVLNKMEEDFGKKRVVYESVVKKAAETRQKLDASAQTKGIAASAAQAKLRSNEAVLLRQTLGIQNQQIKVQRDLVGLASNEMQMKRNLHQQALVTLQDTRRLATEQQRQQRFDIQQTRARQQAIAGAGFAAISTGIRPLMALGTPLIAYAFGGPMAAAMAVAMQSVGTIVRLIGKAVDGLKSMVTEAYNFNQQMKLSQIAIAGIVAQTSTIVDSHGRELEGIEKWNAARQISITMQEKLMAMIVRTNIRLEEANQAIQAGMGFLTGRGVQPIQAQEIIIRLTSIAKTLGLEGSRATQQVRAVFGGRRSLVLSLLQSAGLETQKMAQLQGQALYNYMAKYTNQIATSIEKTQGLLKVQLENVGDLIKFFLGKSFDEAGDSISKALSQLFSIFYTQEGQFTELSKQLMTSLKMFFDELAKIFKDIFTPENTKALVKGIVDATEAIARFLDALRETGLIENFASAIIFLAKQMDDMRIGAAGLAEFLKGGISHYTRAQLAGVGAMLHLPKEDVDKAIKQFVDMLEQSSLWDKLRGVAVDKAGKAAVLMMVGMADAIKKGKGKGGEAFRVVPKIELAISEKDLRSNLKVIDDMIIALKQVMEVEGAAEHVQVIIGKKVMPVEDAYNKLLLEREKVLRRIEAVQKREDAILALKEQIKASQEIQIEMVNELQRLNEIRDAQKSGANEEQQFAQIARTTYANRVQVATRALRAMEIEEEKARRLAREVHPVDQLEYEKKLEQAVSKRLKAEASLRQAEIDVYTQFANQQARAIQFSETLTATIEANAAAIEDRRMKAMGITGPIAEEIKFRAEIARQTEQFVKQAKTTSVMIANMQAIVRIISENDALAVLFGIGQITPESLNLVISALEDQRNILYEYRDALEVVNQLEQQRMVYERKYTEIQLKQAILESEIALHKERVAQFEEGSLAALVVELRNNEALRQLYLEDVGIKQDEIKTNEKRIAQIESEANLEGMTTEEYEKTHDIVTVLLQTNERLTAEINKSLAAATKLKNPFITLTGIIGGFTGAMASFFESIGAHELAEIFTGIGEFVVGISDLIKSAGSVGKIYKEAKAAAQVAGMGGAVSGVVGLISAAASVIPIVGQIVGPAIQALTSLFGRAAEKMREEIKKSVENITKAFELGTTDLKTTIASLEIELQKAIELQKKQTSHWYQWFVPVWGAATSYAQHKAREEAEALADEIREQIEELERERQKILETFRFDLAIKRLGAGYTELGQIVSDALNKINEFIGAGGSITEANQYLSYILKDLKESLTGEFRDAQIAALEQAQELLDLEQQRADLIADNEKKIRDILSEGLAERELTSAQKKSRELSEQSDQYNKQLTALDVQIEKATVMMDLDKQLLSSTLDLTDAEAIRNELLSLNVANRQAELDILLQQKEVIDGIIESGGGHILTPELYAALSQAGLFAGTGVSNVGQVNLTLYISGTQISGANLSPSTSQAIQEMIRKLLGDDRVRLGGYSPHQY